ncbi:N-acetylmuramoyl-L-alanine amidase [Cyclonatronum proteinivorum]|uniref:N-acetylmuramoyl-L-alanine amidase n=1 Tax=Cyclonatronum proteinivorum TaxID=1457365 RepID=A0A345ULX3_9BACT|nr:N-acetylmuramoyl-L-alanine amidase [Cyclonatronum proteinivorum]AXJ01475.1 N-acetylmuramoyl-L-alanine amidase [Cyclonatronum proteinivorum]
MLREKLHFILLFVCFTALICALTGLSHSLQAHSHPKASLNPNALADEPNRLERISVTPRSDGLGYVIRFHFAERPQSFQVFQPEQSLIQFAVYSDGPIEFGENLEIPESFGTFRKSPTDFGYGFDFSLHSDTPYLAQSYIDQNRRHVLIGLTEISSREIAQLTDGLDVIRWSAAPNGENGNANETDAPSASSPNAAQHSGQSAEASAAPNTSEEGPVFPPLPELPAPAERVNNGSELVNWMVFDTVVLDAGHGGRDPGAIGASGTFEKTIALAVALKVGEYLNQYLPELNVVYTRDDDTFVGLAERGRIANRNNGHLFVSIHTNSHSGRQAHGAEFYFLGQGRTQSALEVMRRENAVTRFEDQEERPEELTDFMLLTHIMQNSGNIRQSETFAGMLEEQFAQRAQRRTRGVKQAGLQVLFEASMPGVLVELGFISNPQEERFMNSEYGQAILASAIFRAIRDYSEMVQRRQRAQNAQAE